MITVKTMVGKQVQNVNYYDLDNDDEIIDSTTMVVMT